METQPKIRILGIDPGSRVAGFACIQSRVLAPTNPRDFYIVGAGALKIDPELPMWKRVGHLHETVLGLLNEFDPHLVAIERAFQGPNSSSALKLGEVRGAIMSSVFRANRAFFEVTPAEVKKSIAGNGKASKEEVAEAVQTFLKFERNKTPFDVTDAMAIALYAGFMRSDL